jgi:FkbM family methyltransferase
MSFKLNNDQTAPRLGNYIIPAGMKTEVAVDLGSNLSLFELKYNNSFKNIYYFEASYDNFLKGTAAILSKGIKNCVGFNLAAGPVSGELVKIYSCLNQDCGSNSIIEWEQADTEDYHHVMAISMDDIFRLLNVERINYLKIDIEGAEYDVIKNFTNIDKVDVIGIEIHNLLGPQKMNEVREKILQTHDMIANIPAISGDRNQEATFSIRRQ